MNVEDLYNYCLSLPGVTDDMPFDDVTVVMKVCDKMFALIPLDSEELCITLKCDPDKAIKLRSLYTCVVEAYHMNKKHWNTVYITSEISENQVKEWILHSLNEVISHLPKIKQKEYYGTIKPEAENN